MMRMKEGMTKVNEMNRNAIKRNGCEHTEMYELEGDEWWYSGYWCSLCRCGGDEKE